MGKVLASLRNYPGLEIGITVFLTTTAGVALPEMVTLDLRIETSVLYTCCDHFTVHFYTAQFG